jgi:transposase-like protein
MKLNTGIFDKPKQTLAGITTLTEDTARQYLENLLWPDGPVCPHCRGQNVTRIQCESTRPGLFLCNPCRQQFTVTVGTIFEDSHIPLRSWVMAFQMMCASKKGVSAKQVQRQLGLGSYKSAWFMCHRIRYAMENGPLAKLLNGTVEVDETYVGGKPRPGTGFHKRGRGTSKTPVLALVERKGNIRTRVVGNVTGKTLKDEIRAHVHKSAAIITDEWRSYLGIGKEFAGGHSFVRHNLGEYSVNGINTNTVESFFALLKRGVYGTFHHISKKHLHRYCSEFEFRWNHRGIEDGERMETALKRTAGKRLMYREPHNGDGM